MGLEDNVRLYFVLWTLGDRLLSDTFKHAVMKRIYGLHIFYTFRGPYLQLSTHDAESCWNNTTPNSLLRNHFVDALSQHWIYMKYVREDTATWGKVLKKYPDLCQALLLAVAGTCSKQIETLESKPLAAYLEGSEEET
jgi:hypothetical protein